MLEKLVGLGLEAEASDPEEIKRMLRGIETKLADAKTEEISPGSRFDLAYEALLQVGLTALRANGLRPNSRGGHHAMALQTLDSTIGYPRDKLRLLSRFSRMRADGLYDGSFEPSQSELQSLIAEAEAVKAHLDGWLASERGEWKLIESGEE